MVKHKHFDFRGVIYDVDFEFNNSEEWYQSIPKNVRPKKNQPFYHLLAENDDVTYEAYVSEQNLLVDDSENNGKEFIKEYELNYQNILKQENVEMILTKFSWNGIPTTLLLDKNYKVLKSYSGPITYDLISAYSG